MCNPLSMITEQEMKAIECQINNNADEPLTVTVPYILREWNKQKQYIFENVFDGKGLIMERHVAFTKNAYQIAAEMDAQWERMPAGAQKCWSQFVNFCQEKRRSLYGSRPYWDRSHEDIEGEQQWYNCEQITSNHVLAANEVDEEFTIDLPKPDGTFRKYHVQKGSKPMRVLGRIRAAFGFASEDDFKELCVWHSRMLNDKRVEGDFCLSIHPFDYMTMSENNCDWSSCMNWPEGGCYRGGTIEMMNSAFVIVAYMKSSVNPLKKDLGWDRETNSREYLEWNSKKWRTLIIVHPTGIYSVKSYPYAHKEMTQYAMEWIASCIKDRNFEEFMKFEPYRYFTFQGVPLEIRPRTYRMYNDFGSTEHYAMLDMKHIRDIVSEDNDEINYLNFCYSGASECMSCGDLSWIDNSNGVDFDGEGQLICVKCGGGYESEDNYYCDVCGDRISEDDVYWVGDVPVCPDCFRQECFEDAWECEFYFNDEGIKLFILENETDDKPTEIGMCSINNIRRWVNDFTIYSNEITHKEKVIVKSSDLNENGRWYYDRMIRNREIREHGWSF